MAEVKTCVCGAEAVKKIPQGLFHVLKDGYRDTLGDIYEYEMLCSRCYRRVMRLRRRFRFTGVDYVIKYYESIDLFVIYSVNEYGDEAHMSERDKNVKKAIRDPWTGEIVFMNGDKVTGVF